MAMKKVCWLLVVMILTLGAEANNILSLSSSIGHPGDTLTLSISMDNTDDISALQTMIPLNANIRYVQGSAILSMDRSNGHIISATSVNDTLKIYSYSLSLNTYHGNSGEIISFKVVLDKEPTDYNLSLVNSRLSSVNGTHYVCSVNHGRVTILSPKIVVNNSKVNFGHVPIRNTYNSYISVSNGGNEVLVLDSVRFNDDVYSSTFQSVCLQTGESCNIPIVYSPVRAGIVTNSAIIYSNAINDSTVVNLVADPFSVNELHILNAEGFNDSIVMINIQMNNMDSVVGFQAKIILPEALLYQVQSFRLNAERKDDHVCFSGMNGDTLILVAYSPNNKAFLLEDGIIASFDVRLHGRGGYYHLDFPSAVITTKTAENVISDKYASYVRINSGTISCNSSLSLGNTSVLDIASTDFNIKNDGNAPLVIENILFTQDSFLVDNTLPLIVAPYASQNIKVKYIGRTDGVYSCLMKIYSNDSDNPMQDVSVNISRFEPNMIFLSACDSIASYKDWDVCVEVENYSSVSALQFDYTYPRTKYNVNIDDFTLTSRANDHNLIVTSIGDSTYRVLVFSMQNNDFVANNGSIVNIKHHCSDSLAAGNYSIHFNNVTLGNNIGLNKLTDSVNSLSVNIFRPHYNVIATTNNASCSVSGTGEYLYGDQVTLVANSTEKCRFLQWDDEDTNSTKRFIVRNDTSFEAYFKQFDTLISTVGICDSFYVFGCDTLCTSGIYTYGNTSPYFDTTYVLHLSVYHKYSIPLTAAICEGGAYTENGFNASEAGTYTQNLQTVNGCDSIITLNLTVNPVENTNLTAAICEGSAYTENGFNVSEAGTYTQTLHTVNGCDSIVTLNLTISNVVNNDITAAICEGSSYTENGFNASEAGTYTQTLQTIDGCDSIVTLNLTVNTVESTNLTAAICEGSAYTENGFNVSEAGTYTQTLQTIDGCDSIVTLNLTISNVVNNDITAAICEGSAYTENGFNASEAGTYTQTLQTIDGCDSIVTLNLTINPVANTTLSVTICYGTTYTENGFNASEAGTYTQTLHTVNGCDSIVTLNLTVNTVESTNLTAAICEGSVYSDNGFNVSEAGTYTQNLQTVNGCDSIVTLNLTINPTYNITIDASINEGETYEENGFSESEAGTYVHTLQSEFGCDSVITLNLTVNSSLNDVVANAVEVSLYPNPARAYTTLKVEGLKEQTIVYLFDIQGRKLKEYVLNAAQQTLQIDASALPKGVYTVMLGNTTKKLIVE